MITVQQGRNATQIITYAEKRLLVDPIFADKGTYPPFPSQKRSEERNPLHDSPIPVSVMTQVDAVIITHLHIDHFDAEAKELLPKTIPVFVQNEADKRVLADAGFVDVQILGADTRFGNIELTKISGQHGHTDAIVEALGEVCGVVLRNKQERTVYIAGDTVWCEPVAAAIRKYRPLLIIVNAGENTAGDEPLIMGKEEVLRVHEAAPNALIVATHMEGVNHWVLSRAELRSFAVEHGFSDQLFIPEDGQTLEFV